MITIGGNRLTVSDGALPAAAAGRAGRRRVLRPADQPGFPIGTTTEHATFDLLEPGRRAAWAGDANGVRNCHLWSFTPLPDGGTHVRNTEVFAGFPVAVLRPIVTRRWNRLFQAAVDGLIGHASAGQNGSGMH